MKTIIKDHLKTIEEFETLIEQNTIPSVKEQLRYKLTEIIDNLASDIRILDKEISSTILNSEVVVLNETDLKNKKIYFFHTGKFSLTKLKEIFNVVKSPIDADIVVHNSYWFWQRINLRTKGPHDLYYIDDTLDDIKESLKKESALINKYYELSQNKNCTLVEFSNIKISDNTINKILESNNPNIITPDIQQSLIIMLQSTDQEMFNLGWKSLWQYNYTLNKEQILIIYCQANRLSLKNRIKPKNIEAAFKQWKQYWTGII